MLWSKLYFLRIRARLATSQVNCGTGNRRPQILDTKSRSFFRLEIYNSYGVVICVCDVEFSIRHTQAAGLIKRRCWAICLSRLARAEEGFHCPRFRIEYFDLVIVGISDQYLVAKRKHTERMLQAHTVAGPIRLTKVEKIPSTQCADLTTREIDC